MLDYLVCNRYFPPEMKKVNIITWYIFRQFLSPFAITLFFLTFVFLMMRIPAITNMVVNYNAGLSSIGMMLVYSMPVFLKYTFPMSVMIAVLITFMRMSQENEIIALKGAGVSLYRLLPPVLVFCTAGVALTLFFTVFAEPWAKFSIKKKSIELAKQSIDAALQERRFNNGLAGIMVYVSHVDMKTKELTNVFIEDRRTKGVVSISAAPSGRLIQHKGGHIYTIRLYNGEINQVNMDDNSVNNIQFGNYDINIDLDEAGKGNNSVARELDERNIKDLIDYIRSSHRDRAALNAAVMLMHEKLSIPFACLFLGFLAFPLGVQSVSLRKSSGFGLGVSFFLVYYCLLALGWSLGETGKYPPVLGMWLPNLVIGCTGIVFLVRNANEKPVPVPLFVRNLLKTIKKIFIKKKI